ncbi:MAG: aminotransferase class V-fold PLP-dependent enzyme [Coriobacteriia bacterium]|nr:aminotransferase class V-fold PLP-dependent enzyme [Coriobacteriia bacterium]
MQDGATRMQNLADERYADALASFERDHPAYAAAAHLDTARTTDYARLDEAGIVYLDYTGGGLYAASQIRRHHDLLASRVLGNPHSHSPASLESTALVDETRAAVLAFFNADPAEYEVVFTPNASGALKLVGESYPFEPGDRYLLSYDNHNSVNGIREFARARGASVTYLPVGDPELRLDPVMVCEDLCRTTPGRHHLFAFPAQSNFSGVQHPLGLIAEAQERGWDVILDCAAFAPTNRLDLGRFKPDFVPLSFYKMFGYPTGIGALLVRRDALAKLRRPWFAGGTITLASVQGAGWHHLIPGSSGFEDGTVDYLGLPAVRIGLEHLTDLGVDSVHDRVVALTDWLLGEMAALRHTDGSPLVRVFGPTDMECRGGTVAFYLLDPTGVPYDVHLMEELAGRVGISIRTGCFCNPGDGEIAHHVTRDDMAECFIGKQAPVTFSECHEIIRDTTGKMPNTMRVSFGVASNFADAWRFMRFAESFRDADRDALPG